MPGRPMREYVVVPPLVLTDTVALKKWMKRAFDYVSAKPMKATRTK